ncbi:hypothetical protein [Amycolatopsis solani]|uniref:hypothetical protein n=1 Tax=Amycolatopsis solani TaxID=3028615 RepID=UPI0025B13D7E|nr:hypothetical protein [Amycolatopsis sp. MEP2-6]
MGKTARDGLHRYIVRLPAGNGQQAERGFAVWDKSLSGVRRRYPRAVKIWRATEDRPGLPWPLRRAGQLVRRGFARAWRWARNRDAEPW